MTGSVACRDAVGYRRRGGWFHDRLQMPEFRPYSLPDSRQQRFRSFPTGPGYSLPQAASAGTRAA